MILRLFVITLLTATLLFEISPARAQSSLGEVAGEALGSLSNAQSQDLVDACMQGLSISAASIQENQSDLTRRGIRVVTDKLGENQRYLQNACRELPSNIQAYLDLRPEGYEGVSQGEFINQIIKQILQYESNYFAPFGSCVGLNLVGFCVCRRGIFFGRPSIVVSARAPVSLIELSEHIYQTELPKELVELQHQLVKPLVDTQLRSLLKARLQARMFLAATGIATDSLLSGGDPLIPKGFLEAQVTDEQIELALSFMKIVVDQLGKSYFFDSGEKMSVRWPLIALPIALKNGLWGLKVDYPLGVGIDSDFEFNDEGFRELGGMVGGGSNLNGGWFVTSFIDNYIIPVIMGSLGEGATAECTNEYIQNPTAYMRRSMLEALQNYQDATVDMTSLGISRPYLEQGESKCHLPYGNGNLAPLGPSEFESSSELAAVLNSAIRWTNYDCFKTGGGRSFMLGDDRFRMLEGHNIEDIDGHECINVTTDDLANRGNEFNRREIRSEITKAFHMAKHTYCHGCQQKRVKFTTRKLDYRNHCKWHK